MFDEARDPRIGTLLDGKLSLTRVLGRGGMGVVYVARQLSMDRDVAVKLLHAPSMSDPDSVQRFLHEAKVASKLRHPNVITVFDFGQADDGLLYLVMELLDGKELAQTLELEYQLPPARAVHIMTQICDAVHHAHERGLIHRDLKPENVFLLGGSSVRGDFVKVLDFGIARTQAVEGADRITRTGVMCGTPAYMSPEQILGDQVDARSDIYSLGVMLFELLTGQLPFKAETPMRLLMAHLDLPVPTLAEVGVDVPPELFEVARRALSKKPADRQASALQLADELVAALDGARQSGEHHVDAVVVNDRRNTPVNARRESADIGRDTVEQFAPRGPVVESPEAPPRRSSRGLLIAALMLLIGGGALLALWAASDATPVAESVADTRPIAVAMPTRAPPATIPSVATEPAPDATVAEPMAAAAEPDTTVAAEPADAVAAAPTPPERSPLIALSTTPPGATVVLDGKVIGTTPLSVTRPPDGASAILTLKLARYATHKQTLEPSSPDIVVILQRRGQASGSGEPGDHDKPPETPPAGRDGAGIID